MVTADNAKTQNRTRCAAPDDYFLLRSTVRGIRLSPDITVRLIDRRLTQILQDLMFDI